MATHSVLTDLFAQVQRNFDEADYEAARRDPERHKRTRLMERGKPASYRYVPAGTHGRSPQSFCYSVHRNAAGRYMVWRQIETKRKVKRDRFSFVTTKKSAIALARRHAKAARQGQRGPVKP